MAPEGPKTSPPGEGKRPPRTVGPVHAPHRAPRPSSRRPPRGKPSPLTVTREDRARAEQIVARSGIPIEQAVLVATGRKTLNDVLHEMLALERWERLVREGLDRGLAGQVARGRLPLARARLLQDLWSLQRASFKSEGLRAMVGGDVVAFGVFGRGVVGGVVAEVGRYEVTLVPEGASEAVTLKKHDIKFYCRAALAADVLVRVGRHAEVARLGLGATTELADRFRPTEEIALDWVRAHERILFVFRDGDTLAGVPRRVARFEVEVEVAAGVPVCVLTHALFKPNPYIRDVSDHA